MQHCSYDPQGHSKYETVACDKVVPTRRSTTDSTCMIVTGNSTDSISNSIANAMRQVRDGVLCWHWARASKTVL